MKYDSLTKEIFKFLALDMGNPSVKDLKDFLNDCKGVML